MMNLHRGIRPTLLLLPFLVAVSPSRADVPLLDESTESLLQLSLQDLMQTKVTVANRYQKELERVPATVTLFTREEIRHLGADTLGELLAFVPGFQVDYDSNTANRVPVVSVRGYYNTPLLILIDGEPINDHVNTDPFVFARSLGLGNVERVEVMRGPGSSLYGSSAFLGIVNLVSRQQGSEVRVEAGEHGAHRLAAALGREGQDRGLHLYADLYRDNGQSYNGLFDRNGLTSTSRDPVKNLELHARGWVGPFSASVFHSRSDQQDFYQFGYLGNGANYDNSRVTAVQLGYAPKLSATLETRFTLSYRHYEDEAISLDTPQGVGPFAAAPLLIGPHFSHDVTGVGAHGVWRPNQRHTVSGGVSYERAGSPTAYTMSNYDIRNPAVPYLGAPTVLADETFRFIGDVTREATGVYVQDEVLGYNWSLTLGARYDHFSDMGSRVSPKLAAIYWLTPQQQLKFNYGEAYQAPAMSRLYTENNPATQGNPNLRAVTVRTVDLGYSLHQNRFSGAVNLYANRVEDMIQRVPSGATNQFLNVGSQDTVGVELELNYRLSSTVSTRASASHLLRNSFTSSTPLGTAPPDAYVADQLAGIAVNYNRGPWNLNLNGTYHSDIPALATGGAATVWNTRLRYRNAAGMDTYLTINNLFDARNPSAAPGSGLGTSGTTVVRDTPGRGRWAMVGIEYPL